jgi:hypothetical protein
MIDHANSFVGWEYGDCFQLILPSRLERATTRTGPREGLSPRVEEALKHTN